MNRSLPYFLLLLGLASLLSARSEEGYARLMQGPLLGATGPDYALIWGRTSWDFPVRIQYSRHRDMSDSLYSEVHIPEKESDYCLTIRLDDLEPDTTYFYLIEVNGGEDKYLAGKPPFQFTTAPAEKARFRMAFGSCARWQQSPQQPVWEVIPHWDPDLFFWLGDNVYADTMDPDIVAEEFARQRELPSVMQFQAEVPQLAIWDDHDFGLNDHDRTNPVKAQNLEVWKRYWPNPAYGLPEAPGVFFHYNYGGVDFYFLDDRYYRDPNAEADHPGKTLLGQEQLAWLKEQLLQSESPFKVILCGSMFNLGKGPGGDSWSSFQYERDALFDWIMEKEVSGVVLMTGDPHNSQANVIRWSRKGGYDLYEMVSSPLAQEPDRGWYFRRVEQRVRLPYSLGPNFGVVDFDLTLDDPTLTFNIISLENRPVWEPLVLRASELVNGRESWREKQTPTAARWMKMVGTGPGSELKLLSDHLLIPDYRLPVDRDLPPPPVALPEGISEDGLIWETGMKVPTGAFTLELWTIDHSHYKTGLHATFLEGDETKGAFGLEDNAGFVERGDLELERESEWRSAFNRYWRHLVLAVDDQDEATFYYNGERVGTIPWDRSSGSRETIRIEAEPDRDRELRIENMLHRIRLHEGAMDAFRAKEAFTELSGQVYEGILFPGHFHFTVGPALTGLGMDYALLSFEADREVTAEIRWGLSGKTLSKKIQLETPARLHACRLEGLPAGERIDYEVVLTCGSGQTITSGVRSFETAPRKPGPFRFAVIGDTESRPWINFAVSRQIWSEQAAFVLHTGDLTDNGKAHRKPQWTHEYFVGMGDLQSRVPVIAAPGNGEGSDLSWFGQYFPQPMDQGNEAGFQRFSYANLDVFLLHSNLAEDEFQPGGKQYRWLEKELAASQAEWRIVAYHHVGTPSTFGRNAEVNGLLPLIDRYGVDLVLNGHIHTYERSFARKAGERVEGEGEGTTFVVTGGAGGNLKDEDGSGWPESAAVVYRGHHHMLFEVAGDKMRARAIALDGSIIDTFTLVRKPRR